MQQVVDVGAAGSRVEARRLVEAEIDTAAALARLGPGWIVLHSLPVGPGPATLAHLAVGPQGVFAISSRPSRAPVVEVVGGTARLSARARDDDLAEVRQLAQRVRAALGRGLGPTLAVPPVHALLSLTAGDERAEPSSEVVDVPQLLARLQSAPPLLSTADVQRLAAVVGEPTTWGAPPAEWFRSDLRDRYGELVGGSAAAPPSAQEPDDRVVTSAVTRSSPPQLAVATRSSRAVAVLVAVLGVLSLPTVGLTSLPTLLIGRATLRRHGGWHWLAPLDACLVAFGMVLAVLPLLAWLLFLPVLLAAR